jgi:hypothetical protein
LYGLSACIEVNSRIDLAFIGQTVRNKIKNKNEVAPSFADLNDCFYISACNSVDYTTR